MPNAPALTPQDVAKRLAITVRQAHAVMRLAGGFYVSRREFRIHEATLAAWEAEQTTNHAFTNAGTQLSGKRPSSASGAPPFHRRRSQSLGPASVSDEPPIRGIKPRTRPRPVAALSAPRVSDGPPVHVTQPRKRGAPPSK